jgi:hypothetical protein
LAAVLSKASGQAALSIPLLEGVEDLLFVERGVRGGNHYDGEHCVDVAFGHNALKGGGLYILKDFKTDNPRRVNLLEGLRVPEGKNQGMLMSQGAVSGPDLSWDGRRILFAWAPGEHEKWNPDNAWDIFEIGVDGSGLRRLTDSDGDDFDPCYLPGGRIAFISTRRGGYGRCHPRPVPTYTLHSMKGDGSDVICLSYHETNEWEPSVNNDGMMVYSRWDYVDRSALVAHNLWICNPDGSDPRAPHNNYPIRLDNRPMSEFHIRSIPGSHKYIATAGPHHGQHFGSLILIDTRIPDDRAVSQVTKLTPDVPFPEADGPDHTYTYGPAWPLSEDYYIVNRERGLVLMDRQGNRELIYETSASDGRIRPVDPIPVAPRPMPPVIPPRTFQGERASAAAPNATMYVNNVYVTDEMGRLPQGVKIAEMRIIQILPKTAPLRDIPKPSFSGDYVIKMPLGTVPVEEDGSVYCEAPVGKPVYFQLLDEKGIAVQSMRSAAYAHPGEQLSCVGCHENKWESPDITPNPLALRRPPSRITPEFDTEDLWPYTFYRAVKPVFDNRCAPCHRERNAGPDMSYASMQPYVFFNGGYWGSTHISEAGKFGTLRSSLYTDGYLGPEHYGVDLSDEEFRRVVMWLDIWCQELGAYENEDAQRRGERVWPALDVDPTSEETILGVERHVVGVQAPGRISTGSGIQVFQGQDRVRILFQQAGENRVTLHTVDGRRALARVFHVRSHTLVTGGLETGMYIIYAQSGKHRLCQKLVITSSSLTSRKTTW